MNSQIRSIIDFVFAPVRTLVELPSDKVYPISVILWGLGSLPNMGRVWSPVLRFLENHVHWIPEALGYVIGFLFLAILLSLTFLLTVFVLKWIVQLFGKTISYKKIGNILGYASLPQIVAAILLLVLFGSTDMAHYDFPRDWNEHVRDVVNLLIALPAFYGLVILIRALIKVKSDKIEYE